jgi:hypothetical protein
VSYLISPKEAILVTEGSAYLYIPRSTYLRSVVSAALTRQATAKRRRQIRDAGIGTKLLWPPHVMAVWATKQRPYAVEQKAIHVHVDAKCVTLRAARSTRDSWRLLPRTR